MSFCWFCHAAAHIIFFIFCRKFMAVLVEFGGPVQQTLACCCIEIRL